MLTTTRNREGLSIGKDEFELVMAVGGGMEILGSG